MRLSSTDLLKNRDAETEAWAIAERHQKKTVKEYQKFYLKHEDMLVSYGTNYFKHS